jgi:uncharacterized protein YeaO (DUF488 family)
MDGVDMKLFTIGFTGKSAEKFFGLLETSKASKLIDIRINRTSQLAGFAKEQDLKFFLPKLIGMDYVIREDLAPTKELLASYRNKEINWDEFADKYSELLKQRGVIDSLNSELFDNAVLLCSENEPEKCHRSLLANLINKKFPNFQVTNLV